MLYLRSALAGLLVALGLVALNTATTLPAQGLAKVQCKPGVGFRQVDPIVSRGSTQSHHLHEFFGNKHLLTMARPDLANFSDLVGKVTQCEDPGDSAAYWIPAMRANGNVVPAARFIAYYRDFDHDSTGRGIVPYPDDMRLVTSRYNYTCGQSSSMTTPVQTIPDCSRSKGTTYLTMHVDFPSCWDGKLANHTVDGNTTDNAHVSFYVKGSPDTCPAGFPIKLPELRETISWGNGSPSYFTGKTFRLDSDAPGAPAGSSTHADFWNTWQPAALKFMVENCIHVQSSACKTP